MKIIDLKKFLERLPENMEIDFVTSKKMNIAANGTIFRTDKDSIIVEILNDWFGKRKDFKDKMKKAYKSGDKELGEFYNKRQHAMKIKLNDINVCRDFSLHVYTCCLRMCMCLNVPIYL